MNHRPPHQSDEERRIEAQRALDRVDRESTAMLDSATKRAGDFFAARDGGDDPAEVWGKRVGRILAVLFGLGCVVSLYLTYAQS